MVGPMSTASAKLKAIISDQLGVRAADIHDESRFIDDLGVDSLSVVELLMAIEEEYKLEIPEEDSEGLRTVRDLAAYLATRRR